jgi:tetratricopeptide (TPR) repeat protein
MQNTPTERPLHWSQPAFQAQSLFHAWCRPLIPSASVRGIWQSRWIFDPGAERGLSPEFLFAGRVPGGEKQTLWVANRRVADLLQGAGFKDVHAIGAPAVYVPKPVTKRMPHSLLAFYSAPAGGKDDSFDEFAKFVEGLSGGRKLLQRVLICLPAGIYSQLSEWVWEARQKGFQVIPFEENPWCAASLRETARLFSSYFWVVGNLPGHTLAHAALRGARVGLLDGWGPAPLPPADASEGNAFFWQRFGEAVAWGEEGLGGADQRSPAELASLFRWPTSDSEFGGADESEVRIFCEEWEAERVCAEITARGLADEALRVYASLREQHPANPHFSLVLAGLLLLHAQTERATSVLEEAVRAFPECLPLQSKRAECFFEAGKVAEAAAALEALHAANPASPGLQIKLGRACLASGRLEAARRFFGTALRLARKAPDELLWLGAANRVQPGRALLVSCTASPEERADEILLVQSFRQNLSDPALGVDLDLSFENRLGLPEVYNAKLEAAAAAGYEFVVFVHDDVFIDEVQLLRKLRHAHRHHGFQVIGLAGARDPVVRYPTLWHLMSPVAQQRGAVSHYFSGSGVSQTVSDYGPSPSTVDIVDGLFIAVHVASAISLGWRFNPAFRFHHYDLAASLDAVRRGMTVGVYPIHVIHASPGLKEREDPVWLESDRTFRQLYGGTVSGPTR